MRVMICVCCFFRFSSSSSLSFGSGYSCASIPSLWFQTMPLDDSLTWLGDHVLPMFGLRGSRAILTYKERQKKHQLQSVRTLAVFNLNQSCIFRCRWQPIRFLSVAGQTGHYFATKIAIKKTRQLTRTDPFRNSVLIQSFVITNDYKCKNFIESCSSLVHQLGSLIY